MCVLWGFYYSYLLVFASWALAPQGENSTLEPIRNHTHILFPTTPFKLTEHQHSGTAWDIRETPETTILLVVPGLLSMPTPH